MHGQARERISDIAQSDSRGLAFAAVVLANVALAFGPWFVRLADVGPISVAFWRLALAIPVLAAMTAASGWRPRASGRAIALPLIFGGICFAADLTSWHVGILRTTLANATLFGNSATLFFPIYGFLAARALPTRTQGIALLFAAIGAALLMGRSYEYSTQHLAGDLFCLLAGILYTVFLILMTGVRRVLAPLPALTLSSIASVVPLLLFAILTGERIWPHHWGPLVGIALASQVFGQALMIYALGKLSPLVFGLALLSQPVIGAVIGWIAYGETLGVPDLIGAVLVAIALVLVRKREPAPLPSAGITPRSGA